MFPHKFEAGIFFFIATQKWLRLPDHGVRSRPPGEGLRTLTFNFWNTFQSVNWIFKYVYVLYTLISSHGFE